jgi:Xaa-Pro aminopeptidase
MNFFRKRQKLLSKLLFGSNISAFIVTNKINLRYLTGFHCTFGYLVCFEEKFCLLTDARYTADARASACVDEVIEVRAANAPSMIAELLRQHGVKRAAYDPDSVTVSEFNQLSKPIKGVKLVPKTNLVEELRIVKDEIEISHIKRSSLIMDRAFKKVLDVIRVGITEAEICAKLDSEMILQGIDAISFDTIIASGPRGAFAHGKPSKRKIKSGDFIVMDFGVCTEGYHSDMTRTVFVGTPTAEDRRRYRAVYEAQRRALEAAVAGVETSEPDKVARTILSKFGLDRNFTHGLGHGVGMDVHEKPRLFFAGKEKLFPGMVFTIEPGIYIEGWGGIRIEDTVILTKKGPVPLTKSPKSLIIL